MSAVSAIPMTTSVPPARVRDEEREVRDRGSRCRSDAGRARRARESRRRGWRAPGRSSGRASACRATTNASPSAEAARRDHVGDEPAGVGRQQQRRARPREMAVTIAARNDRSTMCAGRLTIVSTTTSASLTSSSRPVIRPVRRKSCRRLIGQQREEHADRRPRQQLGGRCGAGCPSMNFQAAPRRLARGRCRRSGRRRVVSPAPGPSTKYDAHAASSSSRVMTGSTPR